MLSDALNKQVVATQLSRYLVVSVLLKTTGKLCNDLSGGSVLGNMTLTYGLAACHTLHS